MKRMNVILSSSYCCFFPPQAWLQRRRKAAVLYNFVGRVERRPVGFFSSFFCLESRRGRRRLVEVEVDVFIFYDRQSLSALFFFFFFLHAKKNHAPRGLPAPRGRSSALVRCRVVLEQDSRMCSRCCGSVLLSILFSFLCGSGDGRFRSLFVVARRRRALLQAAAAHRPGEPRADAEPRRVGRAQRRARGRRGFV